MLRSALLLLSGNALTWLLLLARNLLVARLIPIGDYGIASTFAIAMAVVEMMSTLGLQKQIVQAKQGEDLHFQAALQGFQVLRGVMAAVLLVAMAGPIARFLGVPEVTWAYRVMGLVPLLNAFVHFDVYRLNRRMVFWPVILTTLVPAAMSVLAVWPLANWYGDYSVMLYAIIVQAGMTVVTSQLVSRRPYRLVLDRAIMSQSLRFGWPLLLNGALLFGVFHGDKLIVGRVLGMEALAIFAMGFTLTVTPTLVIASSVQNYFLPQLSATDPESSEGRSRFAHLTMVTFQCHLLSGTLMVLGIMAIGDPLIHLLLGEKYAGVVPLLTWLGVMQALRLAKDGPGAVALARGQTTNSLIANIVRALSLPLAWWVAVRTGDVRSVIWIAAAAEAAGLAVTLLLVRGRLGISLRPLFGSMLISLAILGIASVHAWEQTHPGGPAPTLTIGAGLVLWLLSFWAMRDLRSYVGAERIPGAARN